MKFYVNKDTHEVYRETCDYINYPHVIFLGVYDYSSQAVAAALRQGYSNGDGCSYCYPTCYTK